MDRLTQELTDELGASASAMEPEESQTGTATNAGTATSGGTVTSDGTATNAAAATPLRNPTIQGATGTIFQPAGGAEQVTLTNYSSKCKLLRLIPDASFLVAVANELGLFSLFPYRSVSGANFQSNPLPSTRSSYAKRKARSCSFSSS